MIRLSRISDMGTRGRKKPSRLARQAIISWGVLVVLALSFSIFREAGFIVITLICSAGAFGLGRASRRRAPQHADRLGTVPLKVVPETAEPAVKEKRALPGSITSPAPPGPETFAQDLLADPRSGVRRLFREE